MQLRIIFEDDHDLHLVFGRRRSFLFQGTHHSSEENEDNHGNSQAADTPDEI